MKSPYADGTFDAICERIANGESLNAICEGEGMPDIRPLYFGGWLQHESMRDKYALAREAQADALFDDILSIADDGRNDWMQKNFGEETRWVENGEALRRSQLRIDARKWMAGKLRPKKYGEKLELEHSGEVALTPTINFNGNKG